SDSLRCRHLEDPRSAEAFWKRTWETLRQNPPRGGVVRLPLLPCFIRLVVRVIVDLDRLDDGRVILHVVACVVCNLVDEGEEYLVQALASSRQTDDSSVVHDHCAAVDLRAGKSGHVDKAHSNGTEHFRQDGEVIWAPRDSRQLRSDCLKPPARIPSRRSLLP